MSIIQRTALAAVVGGFTAAVALGQMDITVNTIDDVVDFGGAKQVDDLPGPDGDVSFREALEAANNTPGPQSIGFAIPTSMYTTYAELRLDDGGFVLSDDGTTVDFSTQTAFGGDTNPDGNEVAMYGYQPNGWGSPAIVITGNNCRLHGLGFVWQRGYAVQIIGDNNQITGFVTDGPVHAGVYVTGGFGGTPPTGNIIGGTEPGDGNMLIGGSSGLRIDGPADGTVVIGNTITGPYAGIEVRSAPDFDMIATNTRIGGPTDAERNVINGAGRYGEEGFPIGTQVLLSAAINTTVENNFIGTDETGSVGVIQRGPSGIEVIDSENTVIRGNVIASAAVDGVNHAAGQRFGQAIRLTGNTLNTEIYGNRIGVDVGGEIPLPNYRGIVAEGFLGAAPQGIEIGSLREGQPGNTIAFNELEGVSVGQGILSVTIRANSISDNGALGIDLLDSTGSGVTFNDDGDFDVGANLLQNYPDLNSATTNGSTTRVTGSLNSSASELFELDFYASAFCDASGFGEGARYLGSTQVTTDAFGNATFDVVLSAAANEFDAITATATSSFGDTSEFSACVFASFEELAVDFNGDGCVNNQDLGELLAGYLSCVGDAAYRPEIDVTGDGCVNNQDLGELLASYLTGCGN